MTDTAIRQDLDADGILLLTIDVPGQTMNVITPEVSRDLAAAIERLKTDPEVKGAVLTSGKASGFMAGADLKGMGALFGSNAPANDDGKSKMAKLFDSVFQLNKLLRDLETCGKPVAAAVNGLALGGGFEFILACHYRVIADNPKITLGLPEVMVGLFPGAGGTQRLPRAISKSKAMDMLLTTRMIDAAEAERTGLVSRVYPAADVMDEAIKIAQGIAEMPVSVAMQIKDCVNQAYEMTLSQGVAYERRYFHAGFGTPAQKEGMSAFLEKRKPDFEGH